MDYWAILSMTGNIFISFQLLELVARELKPRIMNGQILKSLADHAEDLRFMFYIILFQMPDTLTWFLPKIQPHIYTNI